MKKFLLVILTIGMLSGCVKKENKEKTQWLKDNAGIQDKYVCEEGVKMHVFWQNDRLRKVVVKNRFFTPVECEVKGEKKSLTEKFKGLLK